MNIPEVENKWRKRWKKEKAYEADIESKKEKKYITAAFPYPNSPQHIGHGRTYTTTDIYARYLRLKGYNVLFPMGFHVTGTPIIAMAHRIAEHDKDVLKVFTEIYGIPKEKAMSLTEPKELVTYFSKEIEDGMKEMGYSIDWRRKFYSFDPKFNKFIQWQFRKLKELGYLIKGEYPIAWCPNDRQAVSAHDTRGDVDPELENVTVIKFMAEDESAYFIVTTFRPETVYGVTNIWLNPKVKYVKAKIKGDTVYMAKKAAELLGYQLDIEILDEVNAEKLLKLKAKNPVNGELVPLYPANFVDEEVGTGVVMCVPAHAPYDYVALKDLKKLDLLTDDRYVVCFKGRVIHKMDEYFKNVDVKNQNDPILEDITKEVYRTEAHEGKMLVGKYEGMPVMEAKEKVGEDLIAENNAFSVYTLANSPVYCRCGEEVVVNILKDQWFIDYGNKKWTEDTENWIKSMNTIPEEIRQVLLYTADWLKTRPCTRAKGLGTKFPFDESKMIEALADSTIYMAYYTISNMLSDFDEEKLDEKFFDYVLLGKGKGNVKMKKLRDSFTYWYPLDSRHSGADLLRNHLTLFVFNHVAIFPKEDWPKQIVTNGFVLMDGTKMSKSMGNILPLRKAIAEYGADVIRFSVVCGAELLRDTDFNKTVAEGIKSRIAFLDELLEESIKEKEDTMADKWLMSRLNRKLKNADSLYQNIDLRGISMEFFYDTVPDLKWYMKRTKKRNLRKFFEKWTVVISPFMPHIANEFWEKLGHKKLIDFEKFPEADEKAIDDGIEKAEEFIRQTRDDVDKISAIVEKKTGKKPEKVIIYVAGDWKRKAYEILRKEKSIDKVMKAVKEDKDLKDRAKDVAMMVKPLMKNVRVLPEVKMNSKEELEILKDAKGFFEDEFSCKVEILPDSKPKHEKAKNAMPNKPAIVIE